MDDPEQNKIFVGGISWETTDEILKQLFGKYGTVLASVITKDRISGSPRGFAFVTFSDSSVFHRVLQDSHEILGRTHNGAAYHMGNNFGGHGGRGYGSHVLNQNLAKILILWQRMRNLTRTKCGHLRRSNKSQSKDNEINGSGSDEYNSRDEDDVELQKVEIKSSTAYHMRDNFRGRGGRGSGVITACICMGSFFIFSTNYHLFLHDMKNKYICKAEVSWL